MFIITFGLGLHVREKIHLHCTVKNWQKQNVAWRINQINNNSKNSQPGEFKHHLSKKK